MNYLIKVFQLAYLHLINFLILCTSEIKWFLMETKENELENVQISLHTLSPVSF